MIRKITIVLLSTYLLYILSQSFFKLFDLDTEIVARYKQWAKVLDIETHTRNVSIRGVGDMGQSTTWLITVQIKDKTPTVYLTVGPPPKINDCIPIIVNDLANGKVITSMNNQEWRYGTSLGSCG